jgi:alkanesulfonate monooxygenase SsuD/methylene tetrahydromethanopterin reductase-like flavin-dependent oxidoreductase (luciferase family)
MGVLRHVGLLSAIEYGHHPHPMNPRGPGRRTSRGADVGTFVASGSVTVRNLWVSQLDTVRQGDGEPEPWRPEGLPARHRHTMRDAAPPRYPAAAEGRYGMAEFGYALSSEEHTPNDLVTYARRAEEVGFSFALISDHYHPWIDRQGHSPFVWAVIGGIAQVTERLRLGTGVTCPTIRMHPAIIAQAAATAAAMLPGRFFLGVGTGENLNEHILGDRWPPHAVRLGMLEEAVRVIRQLWQGGMQSHAGRYYTVENARLYTLPEETPPILVAAGGPQAAEAAGRSDWHRAAARAAGAV